MYIVIEILELPVTFGKTPRLAAINFIKTLPNYAIKNYESREFSLAMKTMNVFRKTI